MSTISLRLPESLHKQARELAKQEDISIKSADLDSTRREDVSADDERLPERPGFPGRPTEILACSKEGTIGGPGSG